MCGHFMALLSSYNIAVVIPHFHKERVGNLQKIVDAINSGSLKPSVIIVFNNNADYQLNLDGAKVINSSINFGSSIRYAIAYASGCDVFIGQDDDLMLGGGDLEKLVKCVQEKQNSVIGFTGAKLGENDDPYLTRKSWVSSSNELEEVDVVLGRVTAMTRGPLDRYMAEICDMSNQQYGNHEDIPLCLANIKSGHHNYITKLDITELSTGGVGLEFLPDHFTHRNELAKL